jgi:hypothetical protein
LLLGLMGAAAWDPATYANRAPETVTLSWPRLAAAALGAAGR